MNDNSDSPPKPIPWNKGLKGVGGRPKGSIPWNKGLSDFGSEWRDKSRMASSAVQKGVPKTEAHRTKISEALIGRKHTPERRAAVSAAAKGRPVWNEGLNKLNNPDLITYGKPGSQHWNWRGGIAEDRSSIRITPEYRAWRTAVFRRDGFRCVKCGSHDRIEADHILRWRDHPKLRYEIENGQTLCHDHHVEKTNEERRDDARRIQDRTSQGDQ